MAQAMAGVKTCAARGSGLGLLLSQRRSFSRAAKSSRPVARSVPVGLAERREHPSREPEPRTAALEEELQHQLDVRAELTVLVIVPNVFGA